MSSKQLHSDAGGMIAGLHVVGIQGRFDDNQTPALGAPVLADSQGRRVAIREANPSGDQEGYRLSVDVARRKIDDEAWSNTATRIHPAWPARLGNIVAVVGDRESSRCRELAQLEAAPGESADVVAFLNWLSTDALRSEELGCACIDGLAAWYCTRAQARSLWRRIAAIAKRDVLEAAASNQSALLERASLWLSRAAGDEADMYLAVAGVRRAGYRHWQALLDAGVRSGSSASRLAAVDAAERLLPPPRTPSLDLPIPPMSRLSRRAVLESVSRLREANRHAQVSA
jgi:hypothetical protein